MILEGLAVMTLSHTLVAVPQPKDKIWMHDAMRATLSIALTDDEGNEIILEEGGDGGEE